MLYSEIRIFSENHTKHMCTLFGHSAQFLRLLITLYIWLTLCIEGLKNDKILYGCTEVSACFTVGSGSLSRRKSGGAWR